MKTVFKRLLNFPFAVVKRRKKTKHVRSCDLWVTVARYKNSEIANEKNTKNQIGIQVQDWRAVLGNAPTLRDKTEFLKGRTEKEPKTEANSTPSLP